MRKKLSTKEFCLFLERLEMYASSGIPIDQALRIMSSGMKKHAKEIEMMEISVRAGEKLSEAVKKCLKASDVVTSLISCGESAGNLVSGLMMARKLLEKQDELRRQLLSAITYPAVIGVASLGITIGLVRGVIPQIAPMLEGLNATLPLPTRIVLWVSESVTSFGIFALMFLTAAAVIAVFAYKRAKNFRRFVQNMTLLVPVIGSMLKKYSYSMFLATCGALIDSGKPVGAAFREAAMAIPLLPIAEKLRDMESGLEEGRALGDILATTDMPSYMVSLAKAGEVSGTLGASLTRAGSIADREMDHLLKRLTSLAEPLMLSGMGCVVGIVAVSIMLPIYDVSKVLQQ